MAIDDRERNFEKAMARELRADALNGPHCPDAETLAAYHERLLSPEEMGSHKSHLASCARCQEILATLEVTESISVEAKDSATADAEMAQQPLRPVPAAPVFSQPEKPARRENTNVRQIPKPKPYLRWAVPAGAIAAGLLFWIAINSGWNQRKAEMSKPASAPVEVAENREQKEPQLVAPRPETGAMSAKDEGALKPDTDLNQAPAHEADKLLTDRLEKAGGVALQATRNLPHGPAVLQNQVQNQIQNNPNANDFSYRQNPAASGSGAGAGSLSGSVPPALTGTPKRMEEAAKAASAQAPPPAPASANVGGRKDATATETVEVTGTAPSVETETAAKEKKALAADANAPQPGYAQNEVPMLQIRGRDVYDLGETIVWTPDPNVFWLVLKDGSLRRSENGGKSSAAQSLGEGIKAIAASAPDAKTCWVLAAGNMVFRTVDRGKHWAQVTAPSGADFRTIAAKDQRRATVADATGTVKLATTDGGATWTTDAKP